MAWGYVAVGAGTLLAGVLGSNATKDAANTQADASRAASQAQLDMYNQTRADLAPYRQAGYGALEQLQSGNAAQIAQSDPGYQFRLNEGMKALNANASATGNRLGGAQQKALAQYSQGYASNEYGNAWNRLANLAGIGTSATNSTANAGSNYTNAVSSNLMGAANANAAATMAQANNYGNMINNGTTLWAMYQQNQNNNKTGNTGYLSTGQSYNNFGNKA